MKYAELQKEAQRSTVKAEGTVLIEARSTNINKPTK